MKKLSVFLVILSGVFWGTSAIFSTELRKFGFDALNMVFMRNVIASICMITFALICKRDKLKVTFKQFALYAVSGITLYAAGAFYYAAMKHASISVAVVLMYIAPAVVAVYSAIFFKEKFTYLKGASVVMVIIGTALVSGIVGGASGSAFGVFLGLMAGVAYSSYNICIKYEMKHGDDAVVATAYSFVVAAVISAFLGKPSQVVGIIAENFQAAIPWCVTIGIMTSALPYFLYTYSMKGLPAGVVASLGCVEPLVASLISFIIYSEPISVYSVVGIVLILVSVILLSKGE